LDIVPTCLEAANITLPDSIEFDGNSIMGPIEQDVPSQMAGKPLCFKFAEQWAIIDQGWKLVYAEDYNPKNRPITSQIRLGLNSGKVALYNLNEDIGELKNLIKEEPAKAKELQQKFDSWLTRMKADQVRYEF
jgi:arylsulfatase A-like enzyme